MAEEHDFDLYPSTVSMPSFPATMTRRGFLRTVGAIGLTSSVAGIALTACGGSTSTTAVSLVLGTWPFNKLPYNYDPKKDTNPRDYGAVTAIQDWLKQNPGVTLKQTQVDVSSTQNLTAALAAKTAPDWYFGLPTSTIRDAAALGYSVDTTELVKQYNVDSLLADYALPLWKQHTTVDGKNYFLPLDAVGAGAGVYYRRDLIQAKGMQEPTADWSWDEFHQIALGLRTPGKYVMGAPSYMIGWVVNSNLLDINTMAANNGGGILGSIPTPNESWHWRTKFDPWFDEWKQMVGLYRKMRADEKLILQDQAAYPWEGPAMAQFAAGNYPMSPGFGFQMSLDLDNTGISIRGMSKTFNKPLDELVGFLPYPKGTNGSINPGCSPHFDVLLLNPRLKGTALDKSVSLWLYMYYGEGYVDTRARAYDKSHDPTMVYDFIAPGNRYQKNPKVPGNVTVESIYGKRLVDGYMSAIRLPALPDWGYYFPPDTVGGPSGDPHNDMLEKLSMSDQDIVSVLTAYENTSNQEASKIKSDLSTDEFIKGGKLYFKAVDDYLKQRLPNFYNGDWQQYYHNEVLPVLG